MVRTGQWWDYTDELAHRLADLHDVAPAATAALVRRWSTDEDLWIRRIAIISQLGTPRPGRPRAARRGHRAEPGRPGVLHPQGDRVGAAGVRPRRSGLGAGIVADTHDLSPLSRREALKHF